MAVQAIATKKVAQELDQLSKLEGPRELQVAKVKRSIEQLKSADAVAYYMYLGVLHSILGDYPSSKEFHERSLRLSSDESVYLNYAVSARRAGFYSQALDILFKAFDKNPGSSQCLMELLDTMYVQGDYRNFGNSIQRFSKANSDFDLSSMVIFGHIEDALKYLKAAEVPEDEYRKAQSAVNQILVEHGFALRSTMLELGVFDGVPHVTVRLAVRTKDVATLVKLNDLITNAIISDDELTAWDRMVFTVVPMVSQSPEKSDVA